MGEEKEHTAEQGEREARVAAQHGGDAPVLRRAVRRFIGALRQAEAGHGEEPAGGQRGKDRQEQRRRVALEHKAEEQHRGGVGDRADAAAEAVDHRDAAAVRVHRHGVLKRRGGGEERADEREARAQHERARQRHEPYEQAQRRGEREQRHRAVAVFEAGPRVEKRGDRGGEEHREQRRARGHDADLRARKAVVFEHERDEGPKRAVGAPERGVDYGVARIHGKPHGGASFPNKAEYKKFNTL